MMLNYFILLKKLVIFYFYFFNKNNLGIFRGLIEVICDGQTFLNQIDVNATCVEYLRFIINDQGEELSRLDFGTV